MCSRKILFLLLLISYGNSSENTIEIKPIIKEDRVKKYLIDIREYNSSNATTYIVPPSDDKFKIDSVTYIAPPIFTFPPSSNKILTIFPMEHNSIPYKFLINEKNLNYIWVNQNDSNNSLINSFPSLMKKIK